MGRGHWFGLVVSFALFACADRERSTFQDGWLASSGDVVFGTVAVRAGREKSVVIRNLGRGPITVNDVWTEGPDGTFRAKFAHPGPHNLITGGDCEIKVRYTPQTEAAHQGYLVVRTDGRNEPIVRVALDGNGLHAAARVPEAPLEFGRIEAESMKTVPIELENPSTLPVQVTFSFAGRDAEEFSVASTQLSLEPGERRAMGVTFQPMTVGEKLVALLVTPCEGCADRIVPVNAVALEQAVIAHPPDLDFGQVSVDRDSVLEMELVNISTEPMNVTGFSMDPSSDPSFSAAPSGLPLTLAAEERRIYSFRYTPSHMGSAMGTGHFHVESKRHPTTDVRLRAWGGASELCVSPPTYDYGPQPIGAKVTAFISVKNCGASNAAPLEISEVLVTRDGVSPGEDQFSVAPIGLPRTLAAGQEMMVRAFFEPTRPGPAAAALIVRSNAAGAPSARVSLQGIGREHAPCDVEITPGLVDFGTVPPGAGAVLGIKVTNRGGDICAVKNVQLQSDGGGVFHLPGGPLDGLIMDPGNAFSFQVAFSPKAPGVFHGAVSLEQANPANPTLVVPLVGHSATSCLVAAPAYLDFGFARPDCPPAPLTTNLSNACAVPLDIGRIFIGPGTTDGEFAITQAPATPLTLLPGQTVTVEVTYGAQVGGMNLSPLFVDVAGLPAPFLVPLLGESSTRAEQTDTFVQQDGSKVDVLFVVDNTASMVEEQPRLVAAIPGFVSAAQARNVDLHVAVTTTGIEPASALCPGGAMGGEAGRLFPADNSAPRMLTLSSPDLVSTLQHNVQVGLCAFVEKGFEAMRRALTTPLVDSADDPRTPLPNDGNLGFLRDEAALAVVFVGDEDDHSPDDVDTYVRFLRNAKGLQQPGRATVYAIAPAGVGCGTAGGTGTRYAEAAQKTGGDVLSVCAPDYGSLLQSVASKAFSPQDRFPLSAQPDPATLRVTVDGQPSTAWTYDPLTNQVVFTQRPGSGAKVAVQYRKVCST